MGQSSSSRRRRNEYHQNRPPSSQIPPSSSSSPFVHLPPPPPPPPPPPTLSGFSHLPPTAPPSPPPPPPPPPSYLFAANAPYPTPPPYNYYHYSNPRFFSPLMGRSSYPPYYGTNPGTGWFPSSSSSSSSSPWTMITPQPPPQYVEQQKAKTIKNDINLHKETIRIEPDEQKPDNHLVSFTFDAAVDGSVTIFYFAKEGTNCNFSPIYPDIYMPVRVPFLKGLSQKFCQPPGSGIDLGFFDLDDLSKKLHGDVFPLVLLAEACPPTLALDGQVGQSPAAPSAQITLAVIEKKHDGPFQVKVIEQILWVDGERYELQELFHPGNSTEAQLDDDDPGKECVICMSEPSDTAALPCRHMCMCSECAKALRLQSNKCPICRQPIEKLMEIKLKNGEQ